MLAFSPTPGVAPPVQPVAAEPPPPPQGPVLHGTLLYSKVSKNILCLEAGKDVVDLVVGFLTLPLGCVVKLLQAIEGDKATTTPVTSGKQVVPLVGITSLFNCTSKLEDSRLCSAKSLLVDPRPTLTFGGKIITIPGTEGSAVFNCGAPAGCEFISKRPDLSCPKHKRRMENPCKLLADEEAVAAAAAKKDEPAKKGKKGAAAAAEAAAAAAASPGYIKGDATFMVTNTLEVFPSSTIQSILRLGTQKGEKMSDLESMEIPITGEEIVQLLKASLSSTNVLNDVFGKHCKKSTMTLGAGLAAGAG